MTILHRFICLDSCDKLERIHCGII